MAEGAVWLCVHAVVLSVALAFGICSGGGLQLRSSSDNSLLADFSASLGYEFHSGFPPCLLDACVEPRPLPAASPLAVSEVDTAAAALSRLSTPTQVAPQGPNSHAQSVGLVAGLCSPDVSGSDSGSDELEEGEGRSEDRSVAEVAQLARGVCSCLREQLANLRFSWSAGVLCDQQFQLR